MRAHKLRRPLVVKPHGAAASTVPSGASRPFRAFSVDTALSQRTAPSRRLQAKAGSTASTLHTRSSCIRPRELASAATMPAPVSGSPLAAKERSDSRRNAAARPALVRREPAMSDRSRCRKPPCARPTSCFSRASVKRAAAASGSGPMRVQRFGDATAARHARAMHAAAHSEAMSPCSGCRMNASTSGGSSPWLACSAAGTADAVLSMAAGRVVRRYQARAGNMRSRKAKRATDRSSRGRHG